MLVAVEEYVSRLLKEWGVGQEEADNGVLNLVAPNEREMRSEVDYGLEGILPDGLAGEICEQQFLPRFRDDDDAGGITAGVSRIADIVETKQVPTPEELARFNNSSSDDIPVFILARPLWRLLLRPAHAHGAARDVHRHAVHAGASGRW